MTLARHNPFLDETGQYAHLDDLLRHVHIHCGAKVTRSALANRLKVLGWEMVGLTRTDEKRTITKNYWHKAF